MRVAVPEASHKVAWSGWARTAHAGLRRTEVGVDGALGKFRVVLAVSESPYMGWVTKATKASGLTATGRESTWIIGPL